MKTRFGKDPLIVGCIGSAALLRRCARKAPADCDMLEVRLDQNGNVIGTPEVIDQQGVTASNRPQAKLHAERAVQAVKLASPFRNLPGEFYDQWKWLRPLRFDARLNR